jgi:hypothetical protein
MFTHDNVGAWDEDLEVHSPSRACFVTSTEMFT